MILQTSFGIEVTGSLMRATKVGKALRRKIGGKSQLDIEAAAHMLGCNVTFRPFVSIHEVTVGAFIAVAERLTPEWRRWSIAHAIGHRLIHTGNVLWLRNHTQLAIPYEREAEQFAYALLVDEEEAAREGLGTAWEIAEYFGVPEEMVRVQGRLSL